MKIPAYRPGARALTHSLLAMALLTLPDIMWIATAQAQVSPAAAAASRALGTVKSVSGNDVVITTDTGTTVAVTLAAAVRVQQLAPGSTDLKTAQAGTADAIATGDRVLVSGTAGDAGALTATRVILMKSAAIAQRNQSSQADWNRRGMGGIVTAVDPLTGTLSISSGTRKVSVDTTKATVYRRYAPGSVKFEEAKPGTLADIHQGDQVRARGDKSADGLTVTAEEIVSGAFRNLSGTIASVNASANTLVIKDLATKKNETVVLGSESDLRALPPEIAARFAPGRTRAGAPGSAPSAAGGPGAGAPRPPQSSEASAASRPEGPPAAGGRPAGAYGGEGRAPGMGGRSAGADLSQMIPRLPKTTLADFKPGEALMIVASGNSGGPYTAITVLSGVEAMLTGPAGSEITLPPWSSGAGGGAEAGGGGPE